MRSLSSGNCRVPCPKKHAHTHVPTHTHTHTQSQASAIWQKKRTNVKYFIRTVKLIQNYRAYSYESLTSPLTVSLSQYQACERSSVGHIIMLIFLAMRFYSQISLFPDMPTIFAVDRHNVCRVYRR